jgi:ribosomal protein L24
MKLALKIGDEVTVVAGKFYGKNDKISFIDKKNNRVRLEKLKKVKAKGSKGKDLHGTFHVASLKLVVKEAPKEEKKEEAPVAAAAEVKEEVKAEPKAEAKKEAKEEPKAEVKEEAKAEEKKEA